MRAQESELMEEGLRKVPDLYKDDLAQRRIQGRLGLTVRPQALSQLPV